MTGKRESEEQSGESKRIKLACLNCRRKKIRCSGNKPTCSHCERLSKECHYVPDGLRATRYDQTPDQRLEEKFDIRLSLIESKLQELVTLNTSIPDLVRLLRDAHSLPTCEDATRHLQYNTQVEADDSSTSTTPSSFEGITEVPVPPDGIVHSACNAYFKWFHNQPFTFFNESKFRRDLPAKRIPDYLLFAIIATVAKNPRDSTFKNLPVDTWRNYAEQSWLLLVASGGGPSFDRDDCIGLEMVQALLLLAMVNSEDGCQRAVWLKIGLAVRISQDLQLHLEPPPNMSPEHQEERRNLFWSVYMIDQYASCTRQKFPIIQDRECLVRLPGSNRPVCGSRHEKSGLLSQLTTPYKERSFEPNQYSLLVLMTSIMGTSARYMLSDYYDGDQDAPWDRHSEYVSICTNLLYFESLTNTNVPLRDILGSEAFQPDGRINQPKAGHTIFTHMIFHFCHCLLNHPFLLRRKVDSTQISVPTTWMMNALNSGLEHAYQLSQLVTEAEESGFAIQSSFHGYFLLISGSIHALYSHSSDTNIRQKAMCYFLSDLRSLESAGKHFARTQVVIQGLKRFYDNAHRFTTLLDTPMNKYEPDETMMRILWSVVDYVAMVYSSTNLSNSQGLVSSTAAVARPSDSVWSPPPSHVVAPEWNTIFAPLTTSASPKGLENVMDLAGSDFNDFDFSLQDDRSDLFTNPDELAGM